MVHSEIPKIAMSGDELQHLCDQVTRDAAAGDYDGALTLIRNQGPAIWYGLRPERLRSILEGAIASGAEQTPLAQQLHLFVTAGDSAQISPETLHALVGSHDSIALAVVRTARVIDLRLRGRAHVAADLLRELEESALRITPLFDTTAGLQLVLSLQCGITAMLAGRFPEALRYLLAARIHPVIPELVFLTRDALVKSALIHAFFGDSAEARALLDEAAQLPRTISWAEPLIDAHIALTHARLAPDRSSGRAILRSIEIRDVGEMWPFYVLCMHHVMRAPADAHTLKQQIAVFEQLGFPRVEGEGLTGSVFPLVRADMHLRQGNTREAGMFLAQADPEFAFTQLLSARGELADGRAKNAVKAASAVDTDTALRKVHLYRQAILADAFEALQKRRSTITALMSAMKVEEGVRAEEAAMFSPKIQALAESEIPGWPHIASPTEEVPEPANSDAVSLTNREREIIELLATDLSRNEIAAQQYISLNTLKSHITRLYKKLDVSSREEAVHRARLEGWA
jgi:DNA-binding CsgD family transcriptional regulator